MKNDYIRKSILINIQVALLGAIYPEIRAIGIDFDGMEEFKTICYLDREPHDDDEENMDIVAFEAIGDEFDFKKTEVICKFTLQPFSELEESVDTWVYMRQEK